MTGNVNWTRRALLELGALTVIAVGVGFLGPFGTYTQSAMAGRAGQWWLLLMGAYVLVRPGIWASRRLAAAARLPANILTLFVVVCASAPIAMLWRRVGQQAYHQLDGYSGLLPFALLCALGVLAVTLWAERIDDRLSTPQAPGEAPTGDVPLRRVEVGAVLATGEPAPTDPALRARLSAGFRSSIIALQSEDHYVRVHGEHGSELVLMRLRDAVAEMGGVSGEQVHRSWWIARHGVAGVEKSGRSWVVHMTNGKTAVVSRQSVDRLERLRSGPAGGA